MKREERTRRGDSEISDFDFFFFFFDIGLIAVFGG